MACAGRRLLAALTAVVAVVVAAGQAPGASALAAAGPTAPAADAQPVLRYGDSGPAVVTLQRRLIALRYDLPTASGYFGNDTLHAVVAFQKVNGLERDGVVGARTWATLADPFRPVPKYRLDTTSIEVARGRQVVYLARGGAVLRIIDASTGNGRWYRVGYTWYFGATPTGRFAVTRRVDGWQTTAVGRMWRPTYFTKRFAVHGASTVPAYPSTHGGVAITVAAMNRLWALLRVGMPVAVYGPTRTTSLVFRRFRVGTSVRDRPIRGVESGDPSASSRVMVVAVTHGNEPAGLQIVRGLEKVAPQRGLDLWLVEVLNPDGLARQMRPNAHGVDLNRNFPWHWRVSGSPWEWGYTGPAPLSEPESRAVAALIRKVRPDATVWYHQQRQPLVDESGGTLAVERRYASLVGLPLIRLTRYAGSAISWENALLPGTAAFCVELALGTLSATRVGVHVRAVLRLLPR